MSTLALLGGTPVFDAPLPRDRSMGPEERRAVLEVMDSDCLSGFYGSAGAEFLGGPRVKAFEEAWRQHYGSRHAVSVNSATSGLFAAMGAIGISAGDEVIMPCWTMSATAMAPLVYGGIPAFVDVEDETFCLDLNAVQAAITPRTRAILAVNLFGHPARLTELRALADKNGLYLVEDNAQAPLSREQGRFTGTIGHIGVFSLNYHKHIHTGEGGVCVTDEDRLAERLQLIRNHGENLMWDRPQGDLVNMIGFNYRMTELSAAIGIEQLKRIDARVETREHLAVALSEGTRDLPGWTVPSVRQGCRHNYYVWLVRYDAKRVGISRATFSKALAAEGFEHAVGYVRPLYDLPIFQQRRAFGSDGYPFSLSNRTYPTGLCPVAERLHRVEAMVFEPCVYDATTPALAERLVQAIRKVYDQRQELKEIDRQVASAA
jgi:perosamine synthetase